MGFEDIVSELWKMNYEMNHGDCPCRESNPSSVPIASYEVNGIHYDVFESQN